jgi:predicted secreted protein
LTADQDNNRKAKVLVNYMEVRVEPHEKVRDKRSHRIVFVSHCGLNQNAKVQGIARYAGAILPLVEVLLEAEVGIFQMPCPENTYIGPMRWGQVKRQYDSPMFRRHCHEIATKVLDEAEEYTRSGYEILGFIMMDGSPVCGLNKTPQAADPGVMSGGMVWYIPNNQQVDGKGVYCEILQTEIAKRESLADIPFVAYPEHEELESYDQALAKIHALL